MPPRAAARYALSGRIVTMDGGLSIIEQGTVWIANDRISAVTTGAAGAPAGFEGLTPINTQGTIYPGLIELHNHLSYNILPPWQVPKLYKNRDQWRGISAYRALISGPLQVLGRIPDYLPAIVRYVESKCLLSGTTTSQGIGLASNAGIVRYYHGYTRNVEQPGQPDLPPAETRIADVVAEDLSAFATKLATSSCLLLHLSEGIDARSRAHFSILQRAEGDWVISPALTGIHGVALTPTDLAILADHGAALVWSPMSNLRLYGQTNNLAAARTADLRLALGADWSVSGSRNLLAELKVAWAVSQVAGGLLADHELVTMVTRRPAEILGWLPQLGTIEAGKRADLIVVSGQGAPYRLLIEADERQVVLVIIDGLPRCGTPALMSRVDPAMPGSQRERWLVGNQPRELKLDQIEADPIVAALPLAAARDRLRDGLQRLPELALALEQSRAPLSEWSLLLDEDEPRLGLTPNRAATRAPAKPLSQVVRPTELDPLTVADEPTYWERLLRPPVNVPTEIATHLRQMTN